MLPVVLLLAALVAYLIGAIPMGVFIADFHGVDIGSAGSGKTGTTNVLRTVGRRAAALVLLGDLAKGILAVVGARLLVGVMVPESEQIRPFGMALSVWTVADFVAVTGALVGHVWSIYLRLLQGRWRGGRGVATAMGALGVVNPWLVAIALGVGVPTMLISRYVSLGSIMGALGGAVALVALVALRYMDLLSLLFLVVPAFIVVAHRDNIERLLKGTERKLGDKARAS